MEIQYRDLKLEDLTALTWSGDPVHLDHIAKAIEQARQGDAEMVCGLLDGEIVVKGGIDYVKYPNEATIWMVNVKEEMQGRKIGSAFFEELERRIKARGYTKSRLLVEKRNPRAKRLYDRLNYKVIDQVTESWEELNEKGEAYQYVTQCDLMEKTLT